MLPNEQVACFQGKLSLTNLLGFLLEWPKNQHFHYLSLPWLSVIKYFLLNSISLQHQVECDLIYFFYLRLDLLERWTKEIREDMENYKNTYDVEPWNQSNLFLIITDLSVKDMGRIAHRYFLLQGKCAWFAFSIIAQSAWVASLR